MEIYLNSINRGDEVVQLQLSCGIAKMLPTNAYSNRQ
jgi:hypothetical protein